MDCHSTEEHLLYIVSGVSYALMVWWHWNTHTLVTSESLS